jgi:predicted transcriptional regulator
LNLEQVAVNMSRKYLILVSLVSMVFLASFNALAEDVDSDDDGWTDYHEESCDTDPFNSESVPLDSDKSGICDYLDPDDDNDGWFDLTEQSCGTNHLDSDSIPNDSDLDGICDYLEFDIDSDGWSNGDELICGTNLSDSNSTPSDSDSDYICDFIDSDDDNDGWKDSVEIGCNSDPLDKLSTPLDSDLGATCNNQIIDDIYDQFYNDLIDEIGENNAPAIVVGSGSVFLLGLFTSAESFRWPLSRRFWISTAFMIGLVKKRKDGEFQRGRLCGIIESHPGIHLSALTRMSGLGNHQISLHINVLEKENKIWWRNVGRQVNFFSIQISQSLSTSELPMQSKELTKGSPPHQILMFLNQLEIIENKGANGKVLATEIGISTQLVAYHLRSLLDEGLIQKKRNGIGNIITITTEGIEKLTGEGIN